MTNQRNYEALYILPANMDDASIAAHVEKHKKLIEEHGGNVAVAEKWDKRKLAYPIKGHTEGNYCLLQFNAPPAVPAELSRQFRISDEVIRGRVYLREG
jgi:small subunit ribosomal protein S6